MFYFKFKMQDINYIEYGHSYIKKHQEKAHKRTCIKRGCLWDVELLYFKLQKKILIFKK